ncbi:histidine kinase [Oscillospiraceae bacterium PP1C4]
MPKKARLNVKLNGALLVFLIAIVALWAVFYLAAYGIIKSSATKSVEQVAVQSISKLENAFVEIEHIAFLITQQSEAKAFAAQTSLLAFYDKAEAVQAQIDAAVNQSDLASAVVLYRTNGDYYRFAGQLSNALCDKVYYSIDKSTPSCTVSVKSENDVYIGYASGIFEEETLLGYAVVLIHEKTLLQLLNPYQTQESIEYALLTDGKAITASASTLYRKTYEEIIRGASVVKSVSVGLTPFQIVVVSKETKLAEVTTYFGITAGVTAVLFFAMFLMYSSFWKRHVLHPTLKIMGEVEEMGRGERHSLSPANEEAHQALIKQINLMYRRTDEYNRAMLSALKKQINAHFTINALNAIKRLTKNSEMQKASGMCDGLSNLFRYANNSDEFINGLAECKILEDYINIMTIRYPGQFQINMEIDDRMIDYKIPRMCIQPILENAILYGMGKAELNTIRISLQVTKPNILIIVSDTGSGMEESVLAELNQTLKNVHSTTDFTGQTEHIALQNIQKRIRFYFGDDYGLSIKSVLNQGTEITLTLLCKHEA